MPGPLPFPKNAGCLIFSAPKVARRHGRPTAPCWRLLSPFPKPNAPPPPLGLETRIAARLAQHAAPRKHHYLLWRRLGAVAGIAATMTALFLGLHFSGGTPPTVYSDTCCTPQQAASETRDMLFYVSEQLNMGVEAEEELGGPCP